MTLSLVEEGLSILSYRISPCPEIPANLKHKFIIYKINNNVSDNMFDMCRYNAIDFR